MKLMIKESEDRGMNYIQFATQKAEEIFDDFQLNMLDDDFYTNNRVYTDEYPDYFYCWIMVSPYGALERYDIYGEAYIKYLDDVLDKVDLKGYFRSAISDYKINKRNKTIELGIRFYFNNY